MMQLETLRSGPTLPAERQISLTTQIIAAFKLAICDLELAWYFEPVANCDRFTETIIATIRQLIEPAKSGHRFSIQARRVGGASAKTERLVEVCKKEVESDYCRTP